VSASERLASLASVTGARRAAIFRSRGGLLGMDPPLSDAPAPAEELASAFAQAVSISGSSMESLARALQHALAAPRRRPGARGNVLRLSLGRSHAELLLVRGDASPATELADALAALENEALAWEPAAELRPACAFVALDDRPTLLLGPDAEVLALSLPMRRALGGGPGGGAFLAQPPARAFVVQLQQLVARGGELEAIPGFPAPGEVTVERIAGLHLAILRGPLDVRARLLALASAELTPREVACAVELTAGKSYRDIAAVLQLSPDTVKLHLRAVYQKLGVGGREGFVGVVAGLGLPGRSRSPSPPVSHPTDPSVL
jgi:DNA-binding CsgD family transcriptional regulator